MWSALKEVEKKVAKKVEKQVEKKVWKNVKKKVGQNVEKKSRKKSGKTSEEKSSAKFAWHLLGFVLWQVASRCPNKPGSMTVIGAVWLVLIELK